MASDQSHEQTELFLVSLKSKTWDDEIYMKLNRPKILINPFGNFNKTSQSFASKDTECK